MKKFPGKFSRHLPDIQKIWTNSGQTNWTNSGHEKFQQTYSEHEKILDKFWTNKTGQILDMKNSRRQGKILEFFMSRICPVLFVQNLSKIFSCSEYVCWNFSCPEFVQFVCPEFVQIFCMSG